MVITSKMLRRKNSRYWNASESEMHKWLGCIYPKYVLKWRTPQAFLSVCISLTVFCFSTTETSAYKQIISLLIDIKEEQQRQWAVLKDLQARVHGQVCEEEEEELNIDLPLLTMEQLDKTERHLEDTEAQRRMVRSKTGLHRKQCVCKDAVLCKKTTQYLQVVTL